MSQRIYPPNDELAQIVETILWRTGAHTIDTLTNRVSKQVGVDVPTHNVRQAVHYHRNNLSNESGALIVATDGTQTWSYRMTNDPDEIKVWVVQRERDVDTRLRTILSVADTAVRVTKAKSPEGRRARVERRLIGQLVEQIATLDESR